MTFPIMYCLGVPSSCALMKSTAAAERDPVGKRVAADERDHRREARVLERAHELRVVERDRVVEVPPRPLEGEDREEPLLERGLPEVDHRDEEEDRQPRHPRQEQEVRRGPLVAGGKSHLATQGPMRGWEW